MKCPCHVTVYFGGNIVPLLVKISMPCVISHIIEDSMVCSADTAWGWGWGKGGQIHEGCPVKGQQNALSGTFRMCSARTGISRLFGGDDVSKPAIPV